jgi:hypothetical protein
MSLDDGKGKRPAQTPHLKSLADAKDVIASIRPRLLELLSAPSSDGSPSSRKLRVSLTHVDIMKPDRNDPRTAHVLFVGPSKGDADWETLWAVASAWSSCITLG